MIAISIQGVGSGFVRVIRNDPAHPTSCDRRAGVRGRPGGGTLRSHAGRLPKTLRQDATRVRRPRAVASGLSCRPAARHRRPQSGFHRPRRERPASGANPFREAFWLGPDAGPRVKPSRPGHDAPVSQATRRFAPPDLRRRDPTPHRDGWCTPRCHFGAVDASPS